MKLDVPLILQDKDSDDCCFAAVCSVMNFYGNKITIPELKPFVKEWFFPALGSWMLQNGMDVEILSMHPKVFTLNDKKLNQQEIIERFEEIKKRPDSHDEDILCLDYFIQFIKDGGKVTVKIPDADDIRSELDECRPIITVLDSNFLLANTPKIYLHAHVITGIDEKYVYVNDSLWNETGGKRKHKINDYFFAIYAGTYGGIDNGTFMKIRKK